MVASSRHACRGTSRGNTICCYLMTLIFSLCGVLPGASDSEGSKFGPIVAIIISIGLALLPACGLGAGAVLALGRL